MNLEIKNRVLKSTNLIMNSKKPIRDIAKEIGFSKSTIHNDLRIKLKKLDPVKYEKVDAILNDHLETRHIKGGEATRKKYLQQRK